jgi:hypothetical protein
VAARRRSKTAMGTGSSKFLFGGSLKMQRFLAELSTDIEQAAFEQSWRNDPSFAGAPPKV